jgi:hypothetical protein
MFCRGSVSSSLCSSGLPPPLSLSQLGNLAHEHPWDHFSERGGALDPKVSELSRLGDEFFVSLEAILLLCCLPLPHPDCIRSSLRTMLVLARAPADESLCLIN